MSNISHRRHDISDHVWDLLEPHLPGREGSLGGRAKDNRQFINAVFGSSAQELRGEIYHQTMEGGATPIVALSGGEIRVSGKHSWNN